MGTIKKIFFSFLSITFICCSLCLSVFATDNTPTEHVHNYGAPSSKKQSDGTWKTTFYCLGSCNYSVTVDSTVTSETIEPTCTVNGKIIYSITTEFNGETYLTTKEESINSLGHDYSNGLCSRCGDKPKPILSMPSSKSFVYNGKSHSVTLTDNGGTTGEITYHYYIDSKCTKETTPDNSGASENGSAPVKVGRYYVKATSEETDLYKKSTSKVCTLNIRPTAVKTFTASNHKDGVKLSWSTRKADVAYTIYRRTADDNEFYKIATIDKKGVNSYIDKHATGGKYFYNITVDQKGSNGYSVTSKKRSNAASINRMTLKITNNISSVTLKWSGAANASGYYIYRKTKGQDKYYIIKNIKNPNTYTWKDTTKKAIVNGRKSSYYVKAYFKKSTTTVSKTATTTNFYLSRPEPWADGSHLDWKTNKYADGYVTEKVGQERPYYDTEESIHKNFWPKGWTFYKGRVYAYKYVNGIRYQSAWSKKISYNHFN